MSAPTWHNVAALLDDNNWSAAVDLLRRWAESTGCCEVRITLGALLAERQRYFEAIEQWTAVIESASRSGQRAYLCAAFHNLAAVYRELGDYDLARRYQQRAMNFQDDCGPEELLQLANDALAASRWELAEALLEAVTDLAADDDSLRATLMATAAVSRALRGDLFTAVGLLRRAYRGHLIAGDERGAGCDLMNLAAAYRRAGRLRLEARYLSRAAKHFANVGAAQFESQALDRRWQVRQLLALRGSNPSLN